MKKTEISPTYVIIWIVILIAAYGIGFCVHELKLSKIEAAENKVLSQAIKDTKLYVVNEEVSGELFAQTRRTRPQNTSVANRTSAFGAGRGGQMGRGGMQNFSQQDFAAMQEQMMQSFQNMPGNQGNQMYGGFGGTGDPAAMMNGYDPAAMMGGFDPATMVGGFDAGAMGGPQMMGGFDTGAMVAPDTVGAPGVLNPPEPQVEN